MISDPPHTKKQSEAQTEAASPGSASAHWPYRLVEVSAQDADRMLTLEQQVWFQVLPGASAQHVLKVFDFGRGKAVEPTSPERVGDPVPVVGMYGAFGMQLTVPAADGLTPVPMSGLSWVAVHPDHRRRGLLSAMMRQHLRETYDRGEEAVAGLWTAEVAIYGRFGYGPASLHVMLELSRGAELTAPQAVRDAAAQVTTHLEFADDKDAIAALHTVHVATAASTLGVASRPAEMNRQWQRDFPKARGAKERRHVLFAMRDGKPVGYAMLRRTAKWDDYANPTGEMDVSELAAVDSPALFALATRLLDFDLIGKVSIDSRSTDDPLVWWAGGPRASSMKVSDALWIRLVDLPRALTQRGYAAACDVVIDVTDEVCDWNAGRWQLTVDAQGTAQCERTGGDVDLSLDVQVLGSAYLGGRSIVSLAAAGWVNEHRRGAVRELSRAMRADVEPMGTSEF